MQTLLTVIRSLPYTKRVFLLILLLGIAGIVLLCYRAYTNAVIRDYEERQNEIVMRFFKGEFSDEDAKVFIAEKDYTGPRRGKSKLSSTVRSSNKSEKLQQAEDEANELFEVELAHLDQRNTIDYMLFFITLPIIILSLSCLFRLIFRNAMGLRFHE